MADMIQLRSFAAFRAKRERTRIDFQTRSEQKSLFEKAAALAGHTLPEFLIQSAEERADHVIERHEVMTLREESSG